MTTPALANADRLTPVYDRLRELIIRGRLAPGARVTEADVAARLGVSRTPAREAMRRLQQEGLLVPTAGALRTQLTVGPMTREDLTELYHIAGALEGMAARAVAALAPAARRDLSRDLRRANTTFQQAARQAPSDFDRLFELHNAFHEQLMAACAGPRVRGLLAVIRPQLDRYEWFYAPLVGPKFEPTYAEHFAIARAVRDGDPDAAEGAVRANWWNGAERLSLVIDRLGERGSW
jgi:DNA-binding GntR family transcriptional regulator